MTAKCHTNIVLSNRYADRACTDFQTRWSAVQHDTVSLKIARCSHAAVLRRCRCVSQDVISTLDQDTATSHPDAGTWSTSSSVVPLMLASPASIASSAAPLSVLYPRRPPPGCLTSVFTAPMRAASGSTESAAARAASCVGGLGVDDA